MKPRGSQVIFNALDSRTEVKNWLFLGLFETLPYRLQMESWLGDLEFPEGSALLASDNCSSDDTLDWIISYLQSTAKPFIVTKTLKNSGSWGNILDNLWLLRSAEWTTMLHQDDIYFPDHAIKHACRVESSGSDIGWIFSELIYESPEGKRLGYPRPDWLLDESADAHTNFLATLRSHAYAISGATIRNEILLHSEIPAINNICPDSELLLKMLPHYKADHVPSSFVRYIESSGSESRSVGVFEYERGLRDAFGRVFASQNFKQLVLTLEKSRVSAFIKFAMEGFRHRFKSKAIAEELCSALVSQVKTILGQDGPNLDLSFQSISYPFEERSEWSQNAKPNDQSNLAYFSYSSISNQRLRYLALRSMAKIPLHVRKSLFRFLMKTQLGKKLFPLLNFSWQ